MDFAPLRQVLGAQPGLLTSEMLDDAIATAAIEESDQTDWKTEPPPVRTLAQSDVINDIAAFA